MKILSVNYSKGQLRIQQMAFVLVALMIFLAMASLFYFSLRYNNLKDDVEVLREQEIIESVRKMSSTGEFSWTKDDCTACIDLDKALVLKNRTAYQGFWRNVEFLQVSKVYPMEAETECTLQNYPECGKITIINKEGSFRGHSAFVALCRYEPQGYTKCELGKVTMAFETVE